jgi:hypothetical protein
MIVAYAISLLPVIIIGGFFCFFTLWILKNYTITLPLWIVLSSVLVVLFGILFRNENSMLYYHLTDEVGIPAAEVSRRVMILRGISGIFKGLSDLLIILIGISETLNILHNTAKPPQGFWSKFRMRNRSHFLMGWIAMIFVALASSVIGVYYHIA